MNKPLWLLLGTGAALGLNFPLGKLAIEAGVHPVLWAGLICLGGGLTMALASRLMEAAPRGAVPLRYAATSGFLSDVVPHALTFLAIPHIGSGLSAIMFAMSPVTTALLSLILRVRPPTALGLLGIALGLAGAVIIIWSKGASFAGGDPRWLLAATLIPLFLGIGNVYRTLGWPAGEGPLRLASLTNLAAVPWLVAVAAALGGLNLAPLAAIPGLAALQIAVSTVMFLMFFRLQQIGGPTYLSQIGYVAAVIGVAAGIIWFGETYPVGVWLGVSVVAAGVALTTLAQWRPNRT